MQCPQSARLFILSSSTGNFVVDQLLDIDHAAVYSGGKTMTMFSSSVASATIRRPLSCSRKCEIVGSGWGGSTGGFRTGEDDRGGGIMA